MRLTISDVAKRAGVSKTTVSRILNNRPNVEEKTRQNVLKVIEEANYVPNPIAVVFGKNNCNRVAHLIVDPFVRFWCSFSAKVLRPNEALHK